MPEKDPYAHGVKCKNCGQVCRLLRGEERKTNGGFCFYFNAEPGDFLWGPPKLRLCDDCKAAWRETQPPPPSLRPPELNPPDCPNPNPNPEPEPKPKRAPAADRPNAAIIDPALARLLRNISDAALLAEPRRRGLKP